MAKNFDLTREEETIDIIKNNIIPDPNAIKIIKNFNLTICNIENKFELVEKLRNNGQLEIMDDVLRSQVVFTMSSLDYYMHEIIKYGILSIFKKERSTTKSYENFTVTLSCVERALLNLESIDWLEEWINLKHRANTFMDPKKIKEAFALITKIDIFEKVATKLSYDGVSLSKSDLSNKMSEIYKRRNSISHQSDRNEVTGILNEIDEEFVKDVIYTIKNFVLYAHDEIVNDI